ncbi:hypothetical protein NOK12_04460 [Nocardioides sp. OK12]|uniref:hypothetical protein n=1 Tax=Nocardioides sp. OK12 TaxID=2758661 RepID=UPI0021C4481E|nr:hypothetical protein [Nocardioides sp. OK12]GHJ57927.1 hypothetical protein NOK12_04460 [Nocardioides sp. OK12]
MTTTDSAAAAIACERRVALTADASTDGTAAPPAWVVLTTDGRLGLWTAPPTSARVRVVPCDRRGRPTGTGAPVAGQAEVVRSGAVFDEVRGRVREKYGWRSRFGARHVDTVVLVTPDRPTAPGGPS